MFNLQHWKILTAFFPFSWEPLSLQVFQYLRDEREGDSCHILVKDKLVRLARDSDKIFLNPVIICWMNQKEFSFGFLNVYLSE